jgi:DNA-binding MarR family transcriptional regulator
MATLTDADYRRLLAFRDGLRRFLRWSEEQAATVGLTSTQHQLLLAIRGHDGDTAPAVGELATHLQLRHHSAVELVDRAEAAGLVRRTPDAADRRVVRVTMSARGARLLENLTATHLEELQRLANQLGALWPKAAR